MAATDETGPGTKNFCGPRDRERATTGSKTIGGTWTDLQSSAVAAPRDRTHAHERSHLSALPGSLNGQQLILADDVHSPPASSWSG
mmetsp:Transcript_32186/g.76533  ORF Transcript_32186/g.76533 Transcript_32186/m.76533 type:complete len:86 (+) Transcript_32186:806-1063(+)